MSGLNKLRLNLSDEQTQAFLECAWNGLQDYRDDAFDTGNMEAQRKVALVTGILGLINASIEKGDEVTIVL